MEILNQPKYTWPNRLSYDDRKLIVQYYLQGHCVNKIREAFNTTQTTIEYHLMKANVYEKHRKPFATGIIVRHTPQPIRSLAFHTPRKLVTKTDNDECYYDEYGNKYKKIKKSYADYLKEEKERIPILRSNDFVPNRGAGDNFKPMIRVNLVQHIPNSFVFYSTSLVSF